MYSGLECKELQRRATQCAEREQKRCHRRSLSTFDRPLCFGGNRLPNSRRQSL
nr:hypothetical protein [uncultured bacterium]